MDKLKITNQDESGVFEVLFNPTEYSFEDGSTWKEQKRNGHRPELQYTGGDRTKLTMELFFDTYEAGTDVRAHTAKLAQLLVPNDRKRPPVVKLEWGPSEQKITGNTFPFTCVLEKLTQKFTLFSSTGIPVRATVNATFKHFRLPKEEVQRNPQRNSFPFQAYTAKAGDTFAGVAAKQWKDPLRWREIANANSIDNPRILEAGRPLLIPAIE